MKKHSAVCCAAALLVLSLAFFGCGKSAAEDAKPTGASAVSVSETAEPQKALDEIYKNVDTMGVELGTLSVLKDKFDIDPNVLDEFYFNYTNGRFGVADVFILKPDPEVLLQTKEGLEQIKLSRVREFENYDVHNAHQIAQDALIFEQGDYVVMLMLGDTETAREIIDQYIPKK